MNKIWISTLLLTLTTAISAAPIFECTDSAGRKVYTQAGGKNCKASNIGKPSVYTSAPVSTPATPISPSKTEQAEEAVAPVNPADVGAAKRALDTAKKNLEEGKKVRYGNERNYARYLERIKGLEKAVRSAQENYDAAQHQPASQDPVAYSRPPPPKDWCVCFVLKGGPFHVFNITKSSLYQTKHSFQFSDCLVKVSVY